MGEERQGAERGEVRDGWPEQRREGYGERGGRREKSEERREKREERYERREEITNRREDRGIMREGRIQERGK